MKLWPSISKALLLLGVSGLAHAALPVQSWTTSSGTRVLFVQADAIPMLDIQVDFDAGARFDPPGKSGLAQLVQDLIGKGTPDLDEQQFEERLADLGTEMGGGAQMDRSSHTLRTLTDPTVRTAAIALFAQALHHPTFPEDVLAREKTRSIAALKEAHTRPDQIAARRFYALLYGNHPYAAEPTEQSVAAITRNDLENFYRNTHSAARAVVSMIGAIDRSQAEAIAEQLTRDLPAGSDLPTPAAPAATRAQTEHIAHPAQQSHILIGLPAVVRGDPDYFALLVGNHVLGGGGFTSRLMREVREKRGLAYSVYSYFSPMKQAGPFVIGLQTQRAQTDAALAIVNQTLREFLQQGPSAAEVRAAQNNLVGGFPLLIDNNHKLLQNLATIGFYGLPLDYLDHWTEKIAAVTVPQIRAAFARKVDAGQLVTVVVGAE
ncbi:MAG: insulinase family protein [Burkholderiaceae bacterium]|nr:MAG: insulinase family protein [Burkholderiaceae bacterium]